MNVVSTSDLAFISAIPATIPLVPVKEDGQRAIAILSPMLNRQTAPAGFVTA
jgi:hypothetical protein